MRMNTRRLAALVASLTALAAPAAASASQLIDRDARGVRLEVDGGGQALLTYRARNRLRHVLAVEP